MKVLSAWISEWCEADAPEDWLIDVAVADSSGEEFTAEVALHGAGIAESHFKACGEILEDLSEELEAGLDLAREAAKSLYKETIAENYEEKPLGFNVALNNWTFGLRIHKETGSAEIVAENIHANGYSKPVDVMKSFETEAEAWSFVEEFRTGEHHDFGGLSQLCARLEGER